MCVVGGSHTSAKSEKRCIVDNIFRKVEVLNDREKNVSALLLMSELAIPKQCSTYKHDVVNCPIPASVESVVSVPQSRNQNARHRVGSKDCSGTISLEMAPPLQDTYEVGAVCSDSIPLHVERQYTVLENGEIFDDVSIDKMEHTGLEYVQSTPGLAQDLQKYQSYLSRYVASGRFLMR